ncbi:hypothetical protein AB0M02_09955 [Actinoplanes sp. NPDC051861]|uniref:hypothetical protein n=1 Tax=Actinoplanes sp. NPDC051861 TaxID=3155170 RepID=UPI003445456E
MRFFSNEAKDNDERDTDTRTEQDEQPDHVQSDPVAVPQQRAGSPWQHGPADDTDRPVVAEPAPQPTAFGASTVGGAAAASAAADPDSRSTDSHSTDRTTDAASGIADDRTEPLDDRSADRDLYESESLGHPDDETGWDHTTSETRHGSDDHAVDLALDDKGTFDDPHLSDEPDESDKSDKSDEDKVDTVESADSKAETDSGDTSTDVVAPVEAGTEDRDDDGVEDTAEEAPAVTPVVAGPAPFFPAADTEALRERWRDVQLRFVDDPKGATAEAAGLVDEAVDKLTSALRDQRGSLAKGTEDTEALRVELRSYRDILNRLLGL